MDSLVLWFPFWSDITTYNPRAIFENVLKLNHIGGDYILQLYIIIIVVNPGCVLSAHYKIRGLFSNVNSLAKLS